VFWSWNIYAMYQAMLILFVGLVFTQESATASGKTYSFWAGGHIVYFECVLIANLVLLRYSHNLTGWGELLIFLQVTSFFWIVYVDTIMFPTGVIAYFSDEFYSSWTAWLGCFLLASLSYIENKCIQVYSILREMRQQKLKWQINSQVQHRNSLAESVHKGSPSPVQEQRASATNLD